MNAIPTDCPFEGIDPAEAKWREHVERELGRVLAQHEELPHLIEQSVAAGIANGIREIANDDETMKMISSKLSTGILVDGGKQASQWLGNRIITAGMLAITGFGVAWLVKNGKI